MFREHHKPVKGVGCTHHQIETYNNEPNQFVGLVPHPHRRLQLHAYGQIGRDRHDRDDTVDITCKVKVDVLLLMENFLLR